MFPSFRIFMYGVSTHCPNCVLCNVSFMGGNITKLLTCVGRFSSLFAINGSLQRNFESELNIYYLRTAPKEL